MQCVVFDLGGVMIRLADGWADACRLAGVPYRPITWSDALRTSYRTLDEGLGTGRLETTVFFDRLSAAMDGLYTPEELTAIYREQIREEFPGIADVVQALNAAGVTTACLSNTCAMHWVDLTNPERYPAIGLLQQRHASHLLDAMKPDPRIYRRFEAAIAAAPDRILFFDDNQENVLAAWQCGWQAVHVTKEMAAVDQIRLALGEHALPV